VFACENVSPMWRRIAGVPANAGTGRTPRGRLAHRSRCRPSKGPVFLDSAARPRPGNSNSSSIHVTLIASFARKIRKVAFRIFRAHCALGDGDLLKGQVDIPCHSLGVAAYI